MIMTPATPTRREDGGVFFVFSVYLCWRRDVRRYDRPGDVFVNMQRDTLPGRQYENS